MNKAPLRVAVLVTLVWHDAAGGHVKVWERFMEAAAGSPDIDLTVFFLGDAPRVIERGPRARLHLLPPRLGTHRFWFLDSGAGHTDLAGFHPALAGLLPGFDLLVSTDHFSFGRTAAAVALSEGMPLVHSIHTDVETLTRTYAPTILRRLLGTHVGGWLVTALNLGERLGRAERTRLHRHLAHCGHVFVSRPDDAEAVTAIFPHMPISHLRRGVDLDLFHPRKRDRAWLRARFGLPEGRAVAVFAGRADGSKRMLVAAEATRLLLDRGRDLALVVAGTGSDVPRARALCGDRLVAPGVLPQADLARLFASADVLVFPSESETVGNVVLEAMACGLPVVLSGRKGGTARLIHTPGAAGVVVNEGTADAWAAAIEGVLGGDRAAQGVAARQGAEAGTPTWSTVFREDLAAPWRDLVAADRRAAA